jgi:regulator of replication initiation timing
MNPDTPRTDAETYVWQNGEENPFVHKEFARHLERDLAASQAEVERLDHLLADASETNHKLAAEVERLKQQIRNCLEIIDDDTKQKTELHNEVARLRKYVELIEVYSPENEWSLPEWRRLIGSEEEHENPETLFQLYQFRLAPEWRDLLPDEMIQKGDCWDVYGKLEPVTDRIDWKINGSENYQIRTQRPLPVQEEPTIKESLSVEPTPECPNCKTNTQVWPEKEFGNDWLCHRAGCHVVVKHRTRRPLPVHTTLESNHATLEPSHTTLQKQEEKPLEDFQAFIDGAEQQAKLVMEGASSLAIACLVDAVRYLRDEIEQLKKNQK